MAADWPWPLSIPESKFIPCASKRMLGACRPWRSTLLA